MTKANRDHGEWTEDRLEDLLAAANARLELRRVLAALEDLTSELRAAIA
jgi:hypothetical protein